MKRQPLWTYDFTVITIGSFVSLVGGVLSSFAVSLVDIHILTVYFSFRYKIGIE